MEVLDPGHLYRVPNLEAAGCQVIRFIKRSSAMIQHPKEHSGVNTQEVIRVLIDRTDYLYDVGPCEETADAAYYLRMALWCYEARAYRRKQQKLNKAAPTRAEPGDVNATRDGFDDIPFNEQHIEQRPTGPDGHIILEEG